MGNSQVRNLNSHVPPSAVNPSLEDWQVSEKNPASTIWTHRYTNEQLEQFEYPCASSDELAHQRKIFEFRYLQPYLVSSCFFKEIVQEEFCSKYYQGNMFIEKIPLRLNEIQDIPYPDSLHLFRNTLMGFREIYRYAKYVQVAESMVGVNNQGVVKVWINPDFSKDFPIDSFSAGKQESDMVREIIGMLDRNVDKSSEPESLRNFFYRAGPQIDFNEALINLNEYSKKNHTTIPERLEIVMELRSLGLLGKDAPNQRAPSLKYHQRSESRLDRKPKDDAPTPAYSPIQQKFNFLQSEPPKALVNPILKSHPYKIDSINKNSKTQPINQYQPLHSYPLSNSPPFKFGPNPNPVTFQQQLARPQTRAGQFGYMTRGLASAPTFNSLSSFEMKPTLFTEYRPQPIPVNRFQTYTPGHPQTTTAFKSSNSNVQYIAKPYTSVIPNSIASNKLKTLVPNNYGSSPYAPYSQIDLARINRAPPPMLQQQQQQNRNPTLRSTINIPVNLTFNNPESQNIRRVIPQGIRGNSSSVDIRREDVKVQNFLSHQPDINPKQNQNTGKLELKSQSQAALVVPKPLVESNAEKSKRENEEAHEQPFQPAIAASTVLVESLVRSHISNRELSHKDTMSESRSQIINQER